ncbi:hypothetical protein ABZP36_027213 [Zizania latifolia]
MTGLFTRQAAEYASARPVYPKDLFAKLASLTAHHVGYRDLPFPFDDVGLDMEHEMSFAGLVGMLRSWSAVATAREQGVDLLDERAVRQLEEEWGGASLVRKVTYKAFLLAGTVRSHG